MPGTVLRHNPAYIVSQALIDMGLGTDPTSTTPSDSNWPVYYSNQPDSPDSVLSVFWTEGITGSRIQNDGTRDQTYGINIRIRSSEEDVSGYKARQIKDALDRLYQRQVNLGGETYLIHAFVLTSDAIDNGKDLSPTKRSVFTINTLAQIDNLGA